MTLSKQIQTRILYWTLFVFGIVALVNSIIPVWVWAQSSTSSVVDTVGILNPTGYLSSQQRHTFYAVGRHWVFYTDGANVLFNSSPDGYTWIGSTALEVSTKSNEFAIHYDETYLHYVYARDQAGQPVNYRRGTPQPDGTITWDAALQIAQVGGANRYQKPCVSVDNTGHAWISYTDQVAGFFVTKNNNTDGTWATAGGYPQNLEAGGNRFGTIINLTGNNMYAVFTSNTGARIHGKPYAGGAWGAKEDIDLSITAYGHWSAISNTGKVYVAYNDTGVGEFRERTAAGAWQAVESIDTVSAASSLCLTLLNNSGDLWVGWADTGDNHAYYKVRDNTGVWDAAKTDWLDESANGFTSPAAHAGDASSSLESYNPLGYLFTVGSGPTYTVKYAYYPHPSSSGNTANELIQRIVPLIWAVTVILFCLYMAKKGMVGLAITGLIVGIVGYIVISVMVSVLI